MLKKMTMALLIAATVVAGAATVQAAQKESVDTKAVARAKEIRSQAEGLKKQAASLKKTATSLEDSASGLLTVAADIETNAHKLNGQCKQGSHVSIDTIKKAYKNCKQCTSVKVKDGECARKSGAHMHYYCYCDC